MIEEVKKEKLMRAILAGATSAVVFIVAATLAADIYPFLKGKLASLFYHHWAGKGLLAIMVFLLTAAAVYPLAPTEHYLKIKRSLAVLFWTALAGTFILFLFFLLENFKR